MRTLLVTCLAALSAGCVTLPELVAPWQPVGGSRADGIVTVGFQVAPHRPWDTNWPQARAAATQACQGWGYAGAEPFGNPEYVVRHCVQWNALFHTICDLQQVSQRWQCTGPLQGGAGR